VSTNPVPGTSVQLAEEGNVFLWDVVMQGPEDSIYAVCTSTLSLPPQSSSNTHTERQIQDFSLATQGIPFQASHRLLQDQDLPPKRQQR
jgi:hypothetical protein